MKSHNTNDLIIQMYIFCVKNAVIDLAMTFQLILLAGLRAELFPFPLY